MAEPINHDIQRTGEEAERLLAELETTGNQSSPPPSSLPSRRRFVLLITGLSVLGLILGVGLSVRLIDAQNDVADVSQFEPLTYRASCGSADSMAGEWWPVLGPANQQLLSLIKREYCGDAYIIGTRALQAASFNNQAEAENFAARISAATRVPFRVGKPHVP
jgi:hypothetical protein